MTKRGGSAGGKRARMARAPSQPQTQSQMQGEGTTAAPGDGKAGSLRADSSEIKLSFSIGDRPIEANERPPSAPVVRAPRRQSRQSRLSLFGDRCKISSRPTDHTNAATATTTTTTAAAAAAAPTEERVAGSGRARRQSGAGSVSSGGSGAAAGLLPVPLGAGSRASLAAAEEEALEDATDALADPCSDLQGVLETVLGHFSAPAVQVVARGKHIGVEDPEELQATLGRILQVFTASEERLAEARRLCLRLKTAEAIRERQRQPAAAAAAAAAELRRAEEAREEGASAQLRRELEKERARAEGLARDAEEQEELKRQIGQYWKARLAEQAAAHAREQEEAEREMRIVVEEARTGVSAEVDSVLQELKDEQARSAQLRGQLDKQAEEGARLREAAAAQEREKLSALTELQCRTDEAEATAERLAAAEEVRAQAARRIAELEAEAEAKQAAEGSLQAQAEELRQAREKDELLMKGLQEMLLASRAAEAELEERLKQLVRMHTEAEETALRLGEELRLAEENASVVLVAPEEEEEPPAAAAEPSAPGTPTPPPESEEDLALRAREFAMREVEKLNQEKERKLREGLVVVLCKNASTAALRNSYSSLERYAAWRQKTKVEQALSQRMAAMRAEVSQLGKELEEAGRRVAAKDAEVHAATRRCAALQQKLDERDSKKEKLSSSEEEREAWDFLAKFRKFVEHFCKRFRMRKLSYQALAAIKRGDGGGGGGPVAVRVFRASGDFLKCFSNLLSIERTLRRLKAAQTLITVGERLALERERRRLARREAQREMEERLQKEEAAVTRRASQADDLKKKITTEITSLYANAVLVPPEEDAVVGSVQSEYRSLQQGRHLARVDRTKHMLSLIQQEKWCYATTETLQWRNGIGGTQLLSPSSVASAPKAAAPPPLPAAAPTPTPAPGGPVVAFPGCDLPSKRAGHVPPLHGNGAPPASVLVGGGVAPVAALLLPGKLLPASHVSYVSSTSHQLGFAAASLPQAPVDASAQKAAQPLRGHYSHVQGEGGPQHYPQHARALHCGPRAYHKPTCAPDAERRVAECAVGEPPAEAKWTSSRAIAVGYKAAVKPVLPMMRAYPPQPQPFVAGGSGEQSSGAISPLRPSTAPFHVHAAAVVRKKEAPDLSLVVVSKGN